MSLKNQVLSDAMKEKKKNNLIDEYGSLMWWAGYPINAILAILGGFFDGCIIFAIVLSAFHMPIAAIIAAITGAALLQYLMGSPILRLTKNLKTGKLFKVSGYGKMFFFTLTIGLIAVSVSLYLSWNTDKLVNVAVTPTYEGKYISTDSIRSAYDEILEKENTDYQSEKTRLTARISALEKEKVIENGQWVPSWTARRAKEDIERKQIPALLALHNKRIDEIKAERKTEITKAETLNATLQGEKESTILWGGAATRYGNIGINILRVLIIIFYMIFLMDAAAEIKEEQEEEKITKLGTTVGTSVGTTLAEQLYEDDHAIQNEGPRVVVRGFVPKKGEQPQTLVTQERTTSPNNGTTTPNNRTEQPNNIAEQRNNGTTEQPRTIVREQTKFIVNNTDLVNLKRKCKLYYLRSFFPSNDNNYQKRTNPPADSTLQNNLEKHQDIAQQLKELGIMVRYVGKGKDRTIEFE